MADARTLAAYDANARAYADMNADASNDDLSAFIAAVPQGAQVLDLGCGPGREAAAMAAAGLLVTAFDLSAEMIALAGSHPGVTARRAGFDDVQGVAIYAGIWASFSLLHAPQGAFPGHLARIHRALIPGAAFHLAMKTGTGEGRDRLGRFYAYYDEIALRGHLTAAGFTVEAVRHDSGAGLAGGVDPFMAVRTHA